jgi:hypothetical protein
MERLRAIWARWRLARLEKQRQREAGHVGKTEYTLNRSPQDTQLNRGQGTGWGGGI